MAEIREQYISMLKDTLDYIIIDVEDAQLFSMVALLAKEAEKAAHNRRESRLQKEMQAQHEQYRNMSVPPPEQLSGVGARYHG